MTRLIEQYRTWTEKQAKESLAFRQVSQLERMSTETSLELTMQGLKISKKYLFTQSANLFHKVMLYQRIRASEKTSLEQDLWKVKFPDLPLWIECEGSYIETGSMKAQGFFLTHHYHPEVVKRVKSPMLHDPDMQDMVQKQWEENDWFCDIVGLQGEVVYSFGINASGDPCITEGHVCPWNACTFPDVCSHCQAHIIFWGFWTVIALLMIEGNFATSPELTEYPQVTEVVRRRVGDKGKCNPKKKKYAEEHLTYHVINFDACVRKAEPATRIDPDHEIEQRGSWMRQSLEIDPDSIIYLDKHIAQFQRTLKHPRFTHKQGQTIATREHEKRIPVKVKELTQRITRVIASKYQKEVKRG